MTTLERTTHVHGSGDDEFMGLPEDLRYLMRQAGLDNPAELAKAAGMSWPAVNDILEGHTEHPRRATLEKLAKALRVPVSVIEESAAVSAYHVDDLVDDPDIRIIRARMGQMDPDERAKFTALLLDLSDRYIRREGEDRS